MPGCPFTVFVFLRPPRKQDLTSLWLLFIIRCRWLCSQRLLLLLLRRSVRARKLEKHSRFCCCGSSWFRSPARTKANWNCAETNDSPATHRGDRLTGRCFGFCYSRSHTARLYQLLLLLPPLVLLLRMIRIELTGSVECLRSETSPAVSEERKLFTGTEREMERVCTGKEEKEKLEKRRPFIFLESFSSSHFLECFRGFLSEVRGATIRCSWNEFNEVARSRMKKEEVEIIIIIKFVVRWGI